MRIRRSLATCHPAGLVASAWHANCMSLHEKTFSAKVHMGSGPSYADDDLKELLRGYPAFRRCGSDPTLGGVLVQDERKFPSPESGTLVAVLHQRHGHLEWLRADEDCRGAWLELSAEDQAQLLRIERESRDDDSAIGVLIPQDLANRVGRTYGQDGSTMHVSVIGANPESDGAVGPRLGPDQLAFLWVINEHIDHHGTSPMTTPQAR